MNESGDANDNANGETGGNRRNQRGGVRATALLLALAAFAVYAGFYLIVSTR